NLAFHRVEEPWDEVKVTWDSQPKFAKAPALVARIDPAPGERRLDVTALFAGGEAAPHGWLVRVAEPLNVVGPPRSPTAALEAELLRAWPWEATAAAAFRKARDEGKLVLACVRGS